MADLPHREKMFAFAGVLVVLFLTSLNLTVVGTALPRIIAELEGFRLYAWAFTAYALTSTVSLPIYGRLSDIYGRRRILLFGIALFSVSSALGGLVGSMPQLIAMRALQGLGGGALISMAFSAIGDIFTPRERGTYQGLTGAVFGVSSVIGPLVGGLLTDTVGWRWVFFVNVPVALAAFAIIQRSFPRQTLRRPGAVDILGSGLLAAGIVPLLFALTWAGVDYPWLSAPVLGLLAAAALLLAGFVAWQRRTKHPVLEPALFRDRTFNVANIGAFLSGVGLFGSTIYLPLYVQGVQGGSAAASGMALAPLMLGMVVSSAVAGVIVSRTGVYKPFIMAGLAIMVVGFLLIASMDATTPLALTIVYSVVLGFGIGPTNSLFVLAVQNALPADRLGTVTSANMFFRSIGGTLGVAVFGALVATSVTRGVGRALPPGLRDLPAGVREEFASPNLLTSPDRLAQARERFEALGGSGFEVFVASLRDALASGLNLVFLVAAAVAAVALVVSVLLPVLDLRGAPAAASADSRPAGTGD